MKQKVYPKEVTNEVLVIGQALKGLFNSQGCNLRTIAKLSDMSVNSVKAVLAGSTANIASYSLVAKSLGTTLLEVAFKIQTGTATLAKAEESKEEIPEDPTNDLSIL